MEYSNPGQVQAPNLLQMYLQGRLAPGQIQEQQQNIEQGQLTLEQTRLALQRQGLLQSAASGLLRQTDNAPSGSMPAGAQAGGAPTGGVQNGPQSSVQGSGDGYSPSDYSIPETSMQQLDPRTVAAVGLLGGDTLLKGISDQQKIQMEQRDSAIKVAQMKANGPLNVMDALAASPNPTRMAMANPSIISKWPQVAQEMGLDPVKDFNDTNVARAAIYGGNKIRAAVGLPLKEMPVQLQLTTGTSGQSVLRNPLTGDETAEPGATTPAEQQRLSIEQQRLALAKRVTEGFSGKAGELLAALTEQGVSLPSGMRSKEQQLATINGLLDKHPDLSPDDIARLVKSGKINLTAATKEASVAAGIVGKTSVGENELINFAPLALKASQNVPRGSFMPFNKLQQIGLENISDPNLKELYGRTNAILNAYDVVAARGGTDADKRAENRKNLQSADSPAAYQRAIETMISEAKLAKQSGRQAISEAVTGTSSTDHPPDIQALLDKYK